MALPCTAPAFTAGVLVPGLSPSGVYHYRLEGGDHNRIRSMLLVK